MFNRLTLTLLVYWADWSERMRHYLCKLIKLIIIFAQWQNSFRKKNRSSKDSSPPSEPGTLHFNQFSRPSRGDAQNCLSRHSHSHRTSVPTTCPLLCSPRLRRRPVLGTHQTPGQKRSKHQLQRSQWAKHSLLHLQRRYSCTYSGKSKCAELLLSYGLSLDETDVYGQTPMFYAVSENRIQIVDTYATTGTLPRR